MSLLEIKDVRKSFGGLLAVNNFSMKLETGDIVAVIGPNGAGKTTLFNLITHHIAPDSGHVIFRGEEITHLKPDKICLTGVGRSFQIAAIFPTLTVLQTMQLGLISHYKKNWQLFFPAINMFREEALEVLNNVGMAKQLHVIAEKLPHGDKKRLDVALALATKADLLLLDEPAAGLSPTDRIYMMELLESLVEKQGLTLLFIEHDLDIVMSTAHRICVMHQGTLIAEGRPDEIRHNREVQRIYMGN